MVLTSLRKSYHDLGVLLNLANEREVRQEAVFFFFLEKVTRGSWVVNDNTFKYIETLHEYMTRINFV